MHLISIGSNAGNAADDLISISVRRGETVTVTSQSTSPTTLNFHSNGHSGGVSGTVAASASTSFSVPGTYYLSCAGRANLQITGGLY